MPEELKEDPELRPLVERLERALFDSETRRKIIEEDAYEVTINTSLQKAEAKGKAEGELKAKQETARQMKADGLPIPKISQYTGLKESDIEVL